MKKYPKVGIATIIIKDNKVLTNISSILTSIIGKIEYDS